MAGPESQLRGIFCEAVSRGSSQEQAEYLDEACQGKPELRARVEALLRADREAGDFLQDRSGPSANTMPEVGPGRVIGSYKLLEEIGEGGFGLVYLAEQQHPVRRMVAIKVLKPGMDSRQVIARFEAERQALALMDHPNIARVLDAGETASGRPHFVMELARGVPITDYCEQNGLDTRQRLEMFVTVCDAVQHAHQKGIIHRDLKPSNVLVSIQDSMPVVKVIDFGIAKAIGQQLTDKTLHTALAQIIGTPLYMSPEQAQMGGLDIDTRTDVYSLGVLLYELLTGTTPFDKERLRAAGYDEMRLIIREEDPPRPSTCHCLTAAATAPTTIASRRRQPSSSATPELDWIVMKALEKDRARRYATASAFAADVQRYLDDEPVSACPPSTWYRFGKWARRNKGALFAATLVSIALIVGTAVSLWQAIRATLAMNSERQALVDLAEEQQAKLRELAHAVEAEDKARRELFDALVAQARANRLSRRIGHRFRTLEIVRQATAMARQLSLPEDRFLELRNEAIAAMALPDLRVAKEWLTPEGAWVVFDAKLERYVRTDWQGTVQVRRAGDGAEIWRLPGYSAGELWFSFSPNGDCLAITDPSQKRLHVWRLTGPTPSRVLDLPAQGGPGQFSPDSRQIALQHPDGSIGIFDLATNARVRQLPPVPEWVRIAFHPDGGQFALTGSGGSKVYELESGKTIWQNNQPGDWLEWHPEGKILAICNNDAICFWDVAADKLIGKLEGITGGGVSLTFNPTGTLLASRGWSGIVRLWNPQNCRQLLSVQAHAEIVRFSPDGRFLAATEHKNRLGIWELANGDEYRTLTANPIRGNRRYLSLAMNLDGRLVAAGGPDGAVCLWDLRSGKELAFLKGSPDLNFVGFGPNSARPGAAERNDESLFTRGVDGFFRRSIHIDPATGVVAVGAAEKIPVPGNYYEFVLSRDGKVLAAAQGEGAIVWQADRPESLLELGGQHDVRAVAVSPDGQWVLTGRFSHPGGIKIWSRADKFTVPSDLPGNHTWAVFSPDGKRILTSGFGGSGLGNSGVIRRFEVGTWVEMPFPRPVAGQNPAFSPDGKFVVVETQLGIARLVDAETGRELARLEDPNQDRASNFVFTPDGTKLVCATWDGFCVHVWDLQAIRRQLAEMGLDWQ